MNKEEPHRDQAEKLRKRIEKIGEDTPSSNKLPPRSEIHQHKKKKTKLKLKYPVIRLLVLFFILLPIVSFSIYTILESEKIGNVEKVSNGRSDYEMVEVEKEIEDASTKEETVDEAIEEEPQPELLEPESIDKNKSSEITNPLPSGTGGDGKNSYQSSGSGKDAPVYKYHKVQTNETLFSISMKYYRSKAGIPIIQKANGLNGNEIIVGQTLKIPVQ